jgi:hypothetical protein
MTENPEKKIIVDEDWKSQVEHEREAAEKGPAAEPAQAAAQTPPEIELPPANLIYLAGSLAIQASFALGRMPDPVSGKTEKNLPVAKHLIDLLEVLQEKTEGNRTPEESENVEALLYQLRMAYVQAAE